MKRRVLLILLLLVAGAIVNVPVAIGGFMSVFDPIPLTARVTEMSREPDAEDQALWNRHRGDGWFKVPISAFTDKRLLVQRSGCAASVVGFIDVPPSSTREQLRRAFDGVGEFRVEQVDSGFPMRVLRWECWDSNVRGPPGLFPKSSAHDGVQFGNRVLPGTVLWPGFAINTVFYAFVLWLLFAAPFALRRRRRIKRGQCPKCAYPVGTNAVCTECGTGLK